MGIFRRIFTGLGFLIFLLILLAGAWIFREDIEAWLANVGGDEIVVAESTPEFGPEAAARVEAALLELAAGGGATETRFTETELQSYVRYALALPSGVAEPAIELRDSTVAFSAMLDFRRLEIGTDAAANLSRMLGDSARVAGELLPRVGEMGEGQLRVVSLQAGVFPVPPMVLGMAAQQVGLRADGRTVLFEIPATVSEVRVENGEIVLLRR